MNTNQTYNYNYENTAPHTGPFASADAGSGSYSPRYAAPRKAKGAKVPGRGGAIARLIVMYLMVVIGLVSVVVSIFTSEWTLGQLITEGIASVGLMLLLGAWFWSIMKWVGFIAPKSLGWAKGFWHAWRPLTFFGLYIKFMIFMVILIAPISIGLATYSPLLSMTFYFADHELTIFHALGLLLLGAVLVAVLTLLDVCKIKGWSVRGTVKQFMDSRKR